MLTIFLNIKSLKHVNVLLRIFFVSGVFQNLDIDFWPLLPKADYGGFFYFFKFDFFHSYESINIYPAGLLKIALIITPLVIWLETGYNLCYNCLQE